MASTEEKQDRHSIPRLRSFASALRLGELTSERPREASPFTENMMEDVIGDWDFQPGISVAADVVSTAITLSMPERALDAARYLLSIPDAPQAARRMALVCLGQADPKEIRPGVPDIHFEQFDVNHLHEQVRKTRKQLLIYPSDPVLWANFASLYLSLGLNRQTLRAIRAAVTLAPENRFVLRTAARILLHLNRGEEARLILREASSSKSDPWMLAADISIAASIGEQSEHITLAQKLVDSGRVAPYDVSELAAELATIRALDGDTWIAKRFLKHALVKPCENALAQAAWLARIPGMPALQAKVTVSPEANAWMKRQKGELRESIEQTQQWLNDQPFSGVPAEMGSFVASRINQNDVSIKFAETGLRCNPNNVTLLNNLAFSYARDNQISRAIETLRRINSAELTPLNRHVLSATAGLIAYREGDISKGRKLYDLAIDAFHDEGDNREAVALAYQAMEETRMGTPEATKIRARAINLGKRSFHRREDLVLLVDLENQANGKGEGARSELSK